jgi:hypothetical protein
MPSQQAGPNKCYLSIMAEPNNQTIGFNKPETHSLERKVVRYKEVLENTRQYRELWNTSFKDALVEALTRISKAAGLECIVEVRAEIQNLEAVVLSLGSQDSGLGEPMGDKLFRPLIKQNGSLVYQQLFNGKILVLINYPYIEKYGQPLPPKTIAIYRPEELKDPYCLRHLETFLNEITHWEDQDDETPEVAHRIGFNVNLEDNTTNTPPA